MKKSLFIYRLFIIFFGLWGLSYLFPHDLYKFTYYTNISALLVISFYIYLLTNGEKKQDNSTLLRIKAGVTISIILTFLVYAILLAPKAKAEDFYHIKNYTLHYIVPIMTTLDWLISDKKGAYLPLDPIRWTIIPLLYSVYAIIKGYIFRVPIPNEPHSPYPYFFLNIDKYGWNQFFVYFIAILTAYIAIGYSMYYLKKGSKNL